MKKLLIAMLGCVIAFGACSTTKSAKGGKETVFGTEWKLVSVKSADSDEMITPKPDKVPTLLFNEEKNTISGFGGCNRIMGPYTLKGSSLTFSNVVSTMMMCVDTMNVEGAVTKMLREIDSYKIENGQLVLLKGKTVLATYTK